MGKNNTLYSNKALHLLIVLFLLFYIFNYFTPMCFGDDYVYSFIWEGHPMYEPMSERVQRLSSFHDLVVSQWSHYFTGNGRVVSHTIAQFFLWKGKEIFNIFNALISVFLIIEIYWCANKGVLSIEFKVGRMAFIFFALWTFTLSFSTVFFWLSAACNYLWTSVLLLGFLLPYVHKYYFFNEKIADNNFVWLAMFLFGITAGWSNENSVCWIILAIIIFIYSNRKRKELESWMFTGLAGLLIGYAFLMFAPGNFVRLQAETGASSVWITADLAKANFHMLAAVFCFQFLLWYVSLRSLFTLQKMPTKTEAVKRDVVFIKTLCILSFGMTVMMLFSPNFPPRSSFPGTIQLVIANSVLLRIQEEYRIEFIKKGAKKFICVFGSFYFLVSATASLYGFYDYNKQVQRLLSIVNHSAHAKEEIVTVPPLVPVGEAIANMSGLHILFYDMSKDYNDWRNVSFSRYYGIKGIRMIQPESQKQE